MMDNSTANSVPQELPEEFERLRGMESYTNEMFNRIIEFQEKDHPAWKADLPFAERIAGLPLHALVFSNPDRDPVKYAHTVAAFYPLRDEFHRIAHCIKQVADDPLVCDVHGRNGFIGSLLGREGVRVVALHDEADRPNQIHPFNDPECCELSDMTIDQVDFPFDVAFSSWMPAGQNRTPAILAHRPKLIVFIHTDHRDEVNDLPQTGTPEAFRDLPEHYRLIAEWSITRPKDVLHDAWADLTPSIEEVRQVRIYADTPYHDIDVIGDSAKALPLGECYAWEADLEMTLTVFSAKAYLRKRGHHV